MASPAATVKSDPGPASDRPAGICWNWHRLALAALILFFVLIRLRLLSVPLERDEGEFAYLAQQMLRGVPPYESGYSLKLPGVPAAYAAAMLVLGESTEAIHLALLLCNGLSLVLIFLLGRRLGDETLGFIAAACFGLLSLDAAFQGTSAHAENFGLVPLLAGLLISSYGKHFFWMGLCLGLSILFKQQGAAFALVALPMLVVPRGLRVIWQFCLGVALPWCLCAVLMWSLGVFAGFWFWTVTRSLIYVGTSGTTLAALLHHWGTLGLAAPLIWLMSAVGLGRLLRSDVRAIVWTMLIAAIVAALPTMNFYGHYFIYSLPVLCIAFGNACWWLAGQLKVQPVGATSCLIATVVLIASALPKASYLFTASPQDVCRRMYGLNPFPEAVEISNYIKSNGGGSVFVFGSEPEIYFYTGQRSVTRSIVTYQLVDGSSAGLRQQHEMAAEVERASPEWLVYVYVDASWKSREQQPWIMKWFSLYLQKTDFELVGLADIRTPQWTEYVWGPSAKYIKPESSCYVQVFRRRRLLRS